ncbi:MAG TPA: hypothetical protein VKU00_11305 [Chthonomonadaceae bacterium]|nr:hypothetical protein [Chthonomonadaceae bacterium]
METEFWAVWEAARPLFASDATDAFRQAMTGGLSRRRGTPLTHADLPAWLVPGLAALGVEAELFPLPEEAPLRSPLRGSALPVFAFSGPIEPPPVEMGEGAPPEENGDVPEVMIVRQGIWLPTVLGRSGPFRWSDRGGKEASGTWERFRARFSHALSVRKAARRGRRREHLQAAWLRWLAYSDAYPERVPTDRKADAPVRALAADFLHKVAGQQRDRVSNRLRWAAEAYAQGDVLLGIAFLRSAALQALPAGVQAALLSDPQITALSEIERRELIYLARAGRRDLKVLAARRLVGDRRHPEVQSTLQQLLHDPDPWVRAASRA